jgi:NAD(P)-dependent dehydrogenase (short-subunit alcohol dehydrogenase family)
MIIVAGGSGYLGKSVMRHLLEGQKNPIVNLSSRLSEEFKGKVEQFEIDLTDYASVFASVSELSNKVQAIINLAGRSARKKKEDPVLREFDLLARDSIHDLRILFNLARLMFDFPNLFHEGARLIDIGSLWASHIPYAETYLDLGNEPDLSVMLSKVNKKVFVKYLARELGKKGFTANQLTPGWFPKPSKTPREDYIKGIVDRVPLGRIGVPSDLFPAIDMLISASSTYLNGQEIVIDGGFSIY